jgi:hypothetical protein
MATESGDDAYRAWLERLREVNEALALLEQVARIAQEGFKQYRLGLP